MTALERTAFRVRHSTRYEYSTEVAASQSVMHLTPRCTAWQDVQTAEIRSDPMFTDRDDYLDCFGNLTSYVAVNFPHRSWAFEAESVVSVAGSPRPTTDIPWRRVTELQREGQLPFYAEEMTFASANVPLDADVGAFVLDVASRKENDGCIALVEAIVRVIHEEFIFDPSATEVSTPVLEVLGQRRGVCQDFAHLAIACLRSLGLPARYVSGYLETEPPPGMAKLVGADASHAWISVFIPGFGWLDADPTNGSFPEGRHITVAWGRDYTDVAPSRGIVFGPPSNQQLTVSVDVARLAS